MQLINLYEGNLNVIGDEKYSLSHSWYEKKKLSDLTSIKNNLYNYLRNICKAPSADIMWSTYKDFESSCVGRGYKKNCFVPCNTRATNDYRGNKTLAYLINDFENPFIVQWFAEHKITLNQDAIALSQLVQWIWRSQIRDGKPINLYLPSKRMRKLLTDWLEK